jgi:hypothetical protein
VPADVPPANVPDPAQPLSAKDNTQAAMGSTSHRCQLRIRLGRKSSSKPASARGNLSGDGLPGEETEAVVWLGAVVWITSFEVPLPPVTVDGDKLQVVFAGTPEQVSATSSVNPVSGVTVTI